MNDVVSKGAGALSVLVPSFTLVTTSGAEVFCSAFTASLLSWNLSVVGFRYKCLNLFLPVDDHRQCRALYPADGKNALSTPFCGN